MQKSNKLQTQMSKRKVQSHNLKPDFNFKLKF